MEDPRIISALFIFLKMAYYNVLINIMEEKLNTLKIAVTKLKKENIKLTLQNEELLKEIERLKLQLEKK